MDIVQKLGLNSTFFIQLINFVILVFILYKVLYKPLFKTIDLRNDKIKKGLELTEKMEIELQKIEETKQSVVKNAQDEASKIINQAQDKAEVRTQKILQDAKQKSDDMLKEYEAKLNADREKMNAEIDLKVYDAVKLVMKKVMSEDKSLDQKYISSVMTQKNGK
jgi:F-type H+-transporting ATPase subunit b